MSLKKRSDLQTLYGSSGSQFPDNTTGAITPAIERAFGQDATDSHFNLVDDQYTGARGVYVPITDITTLKAVITVGVSVNIMIFFRDSSGNLNSYKLVSGTDTESLPSVVRPLDYDGSSNQKVWKIANTSTGTSSNLAQQTITSGSSGTVTGGNYRVYFAPSSTLASYTLTAPASPSDGDVVYIIGEDSTFSVGYVCVTAFTFVHNTGQGQLDYFPVTTLLTGDTICYQYRSATNEWHQIFTTQAKVNQDQYAYVVATGTNTYQVTVPAPNPFNYGISSGYRIWVKIPNTNTTSSSIQFNTTGLTNILTATIKKNYGNTLAAGDLQAGSIYELIYNGTDLLLNKESIFSSVSTGLVPVGGSDATKFLNQQGNWAIPLISGFTADDTWSGSLSSSEFLTTKGNANAFSLNDGTHTNTLTDQTFPTNTEWDWDNKISSRVAWTIPSSVTQRSLRITNFLEGTNGKVFITKTDAADCQIFLHTLGGTGGLFYQPGIGDVSTSGITLKGIAGQVFQIDYAIDYVFGGGIAFIFINLIDNGFSKNGIFNYIAKTTTYSIAPTDYLIECTSGSFTVTLPTAVGIEGKTYIVKNTGAGTITVATTSSQTIDGSAPASLGAGPTVIRVMSNGANWITI